MLTAPVAPGTTVSMRREDANVRWVSSSTHGRAAPPVRRRTCRRTPLGEALLEGRPPKSACEGGRVRIRKPGTPNPVSSHRSKTPKLCPCTESGEYSFDFDPDLTNNTAVLADN
ncbi:hypothetical protein [Streptomyces xinghaiensis]|uniref:hypothetical protein n=1 Tax=Streptomyces xinghaiensis TaxID=1038928 RepID=UPI002E14654B|nr:hypothetical protein OG463_25110 [Streptomyces xinghaiensis]